MATKSTPDSVDLKLSNTAAMNGSIASANNPTLATAAANYGLKTVVDQHSLDGRDHAAGRWRSTPKWPTLSWASSPLPVKTPLQAFASALTAYALLSAVDTSSEVDSKIAAAPLGAVTTAALDAAQHGRQRAGLPALSTVDGLDTPLEVDTKIANALLGLAS